MSIVRSVSRGTVGRVARISIGEGLPSINAAIPSPILVPGPLVPLRVGVDDGQIQRTFQENILELEKETVETEWVYVVLMDTPYVPLSLSNEKLPFEREWRTHNVIYAKRMYDAIRIFEEQNGKRIWLPVESPTERQVGIPRSPANGHYCRRVVLERVRKDCVFNAN